MEKKHNEAHTNSNGWSKSKSKRRKKNERIAVASRGNIINGGNITTQTMQIINDEMLSLNGISVNHN